MGKYKEGVMVHFRLNNDLYVRLLEEAKERKVTLSEICRVTIQDTLDRGLFIMEPNEETFVNKMYVHNVKKQPSNPKRVGDIRRAFSDLWKDGLRCVIDVDISTI